MEWENSTAGCQCFECHDKDFCNGGTRNGSTPFLLYAMFGGSEKFHENFYNFHEI